jgi:transcriptional regulator with XRE-family HTH domain
MAGNYRFANYIKDLRKRTGLTMEEVEEKTGISHASISRMENAKQDPEDPNIFKKLSSVYGVSLEEILEAAGRLEIREDKVIYRISPELAAFDEQLKRMSKEKREEALRYCKYLNEQDKWGE